MCPQEPQPATQMHLEKVFFWPPSGKPALSSVTPFLQQPHLQHLVPALLGKLRPSTQSQSLTAAHPALSPIAPIHPATTHARPLPGRPCPHVFKLHDTELPLRSVLGAAWGEQMGT